MCGKVGAGKSTLLLGLLKECYTYSPVGMHSPNVDLDSGAKYIRSTVSYCSQNPVMHAGSVRSNVCFESTYIESRYRDVMRGCGLDVDFNIGQGYGAENKMSSSYSDEADVGQVCLYLRAL